MPASTPSATSLVEVRSVLDEILARRLPGEALEWLKRALDAAAEAGGTRGFLLAYGLAARRVTTAALDATETEGARAEAARPGWGLGRWTWADAARARLLLALPTMDPSELDDVLRRLAEDADLGELVSLYRALPLLPHPACHRLRAAEGVRTNMQDVFEAIAVDNPYPAEELDEPAFNQLVLKAVFLGVALDDVHGLDTRRGRELARMLVDFAAERRAAGRTVRPDLWRPVAPFASDPHVLEALRGALARGDESERLGVALACVDEPAAARLKEEDPELFRRIDTERPTWRELTHGKARAR
jgi:hypothetical protein